MPKRVFSRVRCRPWPEFPNPDNKAGKRCDIEPRALVVPPAILRFIWLGTVGTLASFPSEGHLGRAPLLVRLLCAALSTYPTNSHRPRWSP